MLAVCQNQIGAPLHATADSVIISDHQDNIMYMGETR